MFTLCNRPHAHPPPGDVTCYLPCVRAAWCGSLEGFHGCVGCKVGLSMPNPSMFVSSPWHLPFFFTRRIESQTRLVRPIAQKGTLFPLCFRTPSIQADGPPFRRLSSSSPIPVDPDPIHPLTKGVVRSQPRMGRQGAHPILRGSPSPAHPPPIETTLHPCVLLSISSPLHVPASFPVPLLA